MNQPLTHDGFEADDLSEATGFKGSPAIDRGGKWAGSGKPNASKAPKAPS